MDYIEKLYGEKFYIKMRCIKLLENLEQECEESWRNDDILTKFLSKTRVQFLDQLRDADRTA